MERRTFLIGAGSTAAGVSALIGSGAFTSVTAERDVTVAVADDPDAYLGLEPFEGPNGAYAHTSNGTLELDFTGENPNVGNPSGGEIAGGQGINRNAISTFRDVFTVTNQGTQEVTIGILGAEAELLSPMGVAEAPPTDPFLFLFWSVGLGFKEFDDMLVAYAILPTDLFDELLGGFGGPVTPMDAPGEPPIGGPVILGPGEEQSYSVITVAADDLPEMANEVGANQLQSDLNGVDPVLEDEITFMAVADLEDQFPIGGESV